MISWALVATWVLGGFVLWTRCARAVRVAMGPSKYDGPIDYAMFWLMGGVVAQLWPLWVAPFSIIRRCDLSKRLKTREERLDERERRLRELEREVGIR